MSRRIESGRALQSELVTAACVATGQNAEQVSSVVGPVVEHLQREYGGTKFYMPKLGRKVSVSDIKHDIKAGLSQAAICRKYGISRRTFQSLRDS